MKLYRYRPLSELLFKELLYSELYLSSPTELNDPLDLNGQLNFFAEGEVEIKTLVRFLFKQAFVSHGQIEFAKKMMDLMSYEHLGSFLTADFSNRGSRIVTKSDLFATLSRFYDEKVFTDTELNQLNVEDLFSTLDGLFTQFLNNSSVACFSEKNDNFLMWSHYAGGHTGVCLEFEVDADPDNNALCHFPFLGRVPLEGKYIEWMENVKKVRYTTSLSKLKFFDYMTIFDNAGDVDLMNISKSYWHQYAHDIENIFLEKLAPWSDENEWRIVSVSFQEMNPEDRILTFNCNALTGLYFGAKTPLQTQNRVKNILDKGNNNVAFYKCDVDGTRGIRIYET